MMVTIKTRNVWINLYCTIFICHWQLMYDINMCYYIDNDWFILIVEIVFVDSSSLVVLMQCQIPFLNYCYAE